LTDDPLRLVVFDVDGTIVDSQHQILAAMDAAFQALDYAVPSRSEVLSVVGLSLPVAMSKLAPDLSGETQAALVKGYKHSFMTIRQNGGDQAHAPLYPYAREVITQLSSSPGVLLGVATGKSRRGLDHLLESHALKDVFVTRQVADYHPSKPHPSMLYTCLSDTGVRAEHSVMIGDTEFDIEMGRAAGFHTIGVSWGYHDRARLYASGADQIIDDFRTLPDLLSSLWEVHT